MDFTSHALSIGACAAVLSLAVWFDVKSSRIPNALVVSGLSLGLLISLMDGGMGWRQAITAAIVGLAVFLPLYLLRILGAGDVKLLAVVGSFVGYPAILSVALLTALCGGLLALAWAAWHRKLKTVFKQVYMGALGFGMQISSGMVPRQWTMVVGTERLPYAMAIALGTLLHMSMNP